MPTVRDTRPPDQCEPHVGHGDVAGIPGLVATDPDVPGVVLLAQGFTFWALTPTGAVIDQYPHAAAAELLVPVPSTRPVDPDPDHRPGRTDLQVRLPFTTFARTWFAVVAR